MGPKRTPAGARVKQDQSTGNRSRVVFRHLLAIALFAARPGPWEIGGALLVIAATGLLTAGRW